MTATIIYCSIPYGGGPFSYPEETSRENVSYESEEQLQKYIEGKSDMYGFEFVKNNDSKKSVGSSYDYISNQGGVKIERYKTKKLK